MILLLYIRTGEMNRNKLAEQKALHDILVNIGLYDIEVGHSFDYLYGHGQLDSRTKINVIGQACYVVFDTCPIVFSTNGLLPENKQEIEDAILDYFNI